MSYKKIYQTAYELLQFPELSSVGPPCKGHYISFQGPKSGQQLVQFSPEYLSLGIPRDLVNKGDPSSQLLVVIHLPVHRLLHLLGAQLCAGLSDHLQ